MSKFIIEINIEENKWKRNVPNVRQIIKKAIIAALEESGITKYAQTLEISVLLTNDQSIKELNRNYRNKDKATNVLSFPLENLNAGKYVQICGDVILGDIIFALETITKEATEQNKVFADHLIHLAIHGALHLIGYDHEDEKEATIMEAMEVKILYELGIENPY